MLGVISSEFCKRIICRSIFFHGKIMHDSLLNYSGSFNPNGIPLGTTRVSNLNISLNFPENIPRDPIKGRLRHDSLPMGRKLFFLSVENLADLIVERT